MRIVANQTDDGGGLKRQRHLLLVWHCAMYMYISQMRLGVSKY